MLTAEIGTREVDARRIVQETRALRPHGGDRKSEEFRNQGSNTTLKGRGAGYQTRRLERDRPDLAARVKAGDLSANAAAIEAGFRPKTVTVPLTVDGVTRALLAWLR